MPQRPASGNPKSWTWTEHLFNTLNMRSASDLTARGARASMEMLIHGLFTDDRWLKAFTELDGRSRS
jgi:hypothetical protein